jgi:hypothetical protein
VKKVNKLGLILIVIITASNFTTAQTALGSSKTFLTNLKKNLYTSTAKNSSAGVSLAISESKEYQGKINYKKSDNTSELLIGIIKDIPRSSFYLKVDEKSVEGHILLKATKEAYKYYSDNEGNAYISKVDINSIICIDYSNVASEETTETMTAIADASSSVLTLESLPGAKGCVLLDFDGYYMPAGNQWNDGLAIDAVASGLSDASIQRSWAMVAEDYRPFSVNITTNEAVFNTYPKTKRMRAVITKTTTASPDAGGVAYVGSFKSNNDVPCWIFNLSSKSCGETISHEVGHTFDLQHDGRTTPDEEYFSGIRATPFGPIMGSGFSVLVTQWSKGEYKNANNFQDDVATIAGAKFGVGFRTDDYGNSIETATKLDYSTITGAVTQKNGIITEQSDTDFFTFTTLGGTVALNANTVSIDGNLDILMKLYDETGKEIASYTNTTNSVLSATMTKILVAGKYYISIEGTGAGDPATGGYSDYGSIGSYSITGTIANSTLTNNEFNIKPDILLFPNPSINHIIETRGVEVGMIYEVRDILGSVKIKKTVTAINESIDATSLSSGVYIITINDNLETTSKRIILK